MFVLNVKVAGAEGQVALFFDTKDKADYTRNSLYKADPHESIILSDDHGHNLCLLPREVQFTMVVDMKKDLAHQAEMQLLQLRENQKLQQRVGTIAGLGGGMPPGLVRQ
jgi:hypothetical protein